jgi:hypothetical protein
MKKLLLLTTVFAGIVLSSPLAHAECKVNPGKVEWCSAEVIAYSAADDTYGYSTASEAKLNDADNLAQATNAAIQQCQSYGGADCQVVDSDSHDAREMHCIAIASGDDQQIYTEDKSKAFRFDGAATTSALAACHKHTKNCKSLAESCQ